MFKPKRRAVHADKRIKVINMIKFLAKMWAGLYHLYLTSLPVR